MITEQLRVLKDGYCPLWNSGVQWGPGLGGWTKKELHMKMGESIA